MSAYMTKQRKLLYSFLAENPDRRFTARQIADALAPEGISRSAVYRNLSALEQGGLITRSAGDSTREALYRYVHGEDCRGRIHLTCTGCGGSFHMDTREADLLQRNMAESMGFEIDRSRTVLYGVCRKCRQSRSRSYIV